MALPLDILSQNRFLPIISTRVRSKHAYMFRSLTTALALSPFTNHAVNPETSENWLGIQVMLLASCIELSLIAHNLNDNLAINDSTKDSYHLWIGNFVRLEHIPSARSIAAMTRKNMSDTLTMSRRDRRICTSSKSCTSHGVERAVSKSNRGEFIQLDRIPVNIRS